MTFDHIKSHEARIAHARERHSNTHAANVQCTGASVAMMKGSSMPENTTPINDNDLVIVSLPDRKRRDPRSMTRDEAASYVTRMIEAGEGKGVVVKDSKTKSYETTYARGEKVRIAIRKFKVTNKHVTVRSIKFDDKKDEYVAVVSIEA